MRHLDSRISYHSNEHPSRAPALRTELVPVAGVRSQPEDILAVFQFSDRTGFDEADSRYVQTGLTCIDGSDRAEVWRGHGPISNGRSGAIRYACDNDHLFGHVVLDTAEASDLAAGVEALYRRIMSFIRGSDYPYFFRSWNFLPHINRIEDRLERYRSFCIGRYAALCSETDFEATLPAASAIGTSGDRLLVTFAASRQKPIQVENPRQVSAFRYPPKHGPRSPLFSRAVCMDWTDARRVYLSGTASIVGHETAHKGDLSAQLNETLRNIDATLQNVPHRSGSHADARRDCIGLRVYLRNPNDYQFVKTALESRMGDGQAILYLKGDICRAELLLEIEGVFVSN